MKLAFFISDEGYGHAMRQKNIILELLEHTPFIDITIYTKEKINVLYKYFGGRIKYFQIYNNILLNRDDNGVINLDETKTNFLEWYKSNKLWFEIVKKNFDNETDIIISDSVPQASLIAEEFNLQTIFIHHFSWDWFYVSAFGKDNVFNELKNFYSKKCIHLFPPLTPLENKSMHPKYEIIDFIVNRSLIEKSYKNNDFSLDGKLKLLIMNSGTNSLTKPINNLILSIPNNEKWKIYLRDQNLTSKVRKKILSLNNIELIEDLQSIHDSIAHADLILARAGYNLISEVLALGKLALIVDEEKNPEIESNLKLIRKYENLIPIPRGQIVNQLNTIMKNESLYKKNYHKETCLGATQSMTKIINFLKKS